MTNLPDGHNTHPTAEMFDRNWIGGKYRPTASILSNNRANFGLEVSNQSPHFSCAVNAAQTRLGLTRAAALLAAIQLCGTSSA